MLKGSFILGLVWQTVIDPTTILFVIWGMVSLAPRVPSHTIRVTVSLVRPVLKTSLLQTALVMNFLILFYLLILFGFSKTGFLSVALAILELTL